MNVKDIVHDSFNLGFGQRPGPKDLAVRTISLKGAREHNLKNISVDFPRGKLIVVTGVSGSGKSSLAFDTLFAEGQRRYVESLSAYARQFISQLQKPDLDAAEGLSPAIAIDQKSTSRNPRSTVGTVTEIYDHLRLLYARLGQPHCPDCKLPIASQSVQTIIERLLTLGEAKRLIILAPVVRGRKGIYQKELEEFRESGFNRVRVDGIERSLEEDIQLNRQKKHTIEVVVDRLKIKPGISGRLQESLEIALKLANGVVRVEVLPANDKTSESTTPEVYDFNQAMACPNCGRSGPEMEPRFFSFNSPYGACPECEGLGYKMTLDPEKLVPDPEKNILDGAIIGLESRFEEYFHEIFTAIATLYKTDVQLPFAKLPEKMKEAIFYGTAEDEIKTTFRRRLRRGFKQKFMGLVPYLMRRYKEAERDSVREYIEGFMREEICPTCAGARLRPEALAVTLRGQSIAEFCHQAVDRNYESMRQWQLTAREELIGGRVIKEIVERLHFLVDVGLNYLSLDRSMTTLSGGEAQRIRLATQIGSQLVGVLYVLDEPSIGLHPRDNAKLIQNLKRLRDAGNSIVVVEHDEETIRQSDYLIDIGPGAGRLGGEVIFAGEPQGIEKEPLSLTGAYLSGKKKIEIPSERKKADQFLKLRGARMHNLKDLDVDLPLGVFICVTGVSGSGKSSLVKDTLYEWFRVHLYGGKARQKDKELAPFHSIEGAENIDKVSHIDQKPIGRTPRSNPATYTGLFSMVRDIFAQLPESRLRGWKPGRFSFNVKGGRCEACQGAGLKKIEMHFLPDTFVTCEICEGRRFEPETLQVRFRGANISEVLEMTIEDARKIFENVPTVARKLETLVDVGLGYITLGQAATTLSGGEAQRIKLTRELAKRDTGKTLYILDEPTTGLHFNDVHHLLEIFKKLVARGNTVLVIEHNLDVVKCADHVIDLGPEGGDAGGFLMGTGTPEQLAKNKNSVTGSYLRPHL